MLKFKRINKAIIVGVLIMFFVANFSVRAGKGAQMEPQAKESSICMTVAGKTVKWLTVLMVAYAIDHLMLGGTCKDNLTSLFQKLAGKFEGTKLDAWRQTCANQMSNISRYSNNVVFEGVKKRLPKGVVDLCDSAGQKVSDGYNKINDQAAKMRGAVINFFKQHLLRQETEKESK